MVFVYNQIVNDREGYSNTMLLLNSIVENPYFKKTSLHKSFLEKPLGFMDIGASGGVHPLIMPLASLTHCTCFEPDENAYHELHQKYVKNNPFSKITIFDVAIGSKKGDKKLYITKSMVNTSLLEPNNELVTRYDMQGFQLEKVIPVKTQSLDEAILENEKKGERFAEFIKLDCQGAEYDILTGAKRVLDEQCMAIWCEVEFFEMYKNQRIFSEIDLFLRRRGFQLYALYPHFISAKKINRKEYDSEERIIWADALYFKDPLDSINEKKLFSTRDIEVLLLASVLTHFYDFALEIVSYYFREETDRKNIERFILSMAEGDKIIIEGDLAKLIDEVAKSPEKGYLLAKKFIDKHKSNNSIDFLII